MSALAAFVLVCLAMPYHLISSNGQELEGIRIIEIDDGKSYSVALEADREYKGSDLAVITYYYWIPPPPGVLLKTPHELLVSKVDAVEIVPGAAIGTNGVGVPGEKIKWVDIEIVKSVKKIRFEKKAETVQ